MKQLQIFNVCCWSMILGREILRCLLTLDGSLEWRGWYMQLAIDPWPSYVTMWDVVIIPLAAWYVWTTWNQLEWKDNNER